jgi:hypothetical protein
LAVTLTMSWADLFGPRGTPPKTRRARWAAWLRLALHGEARDAAFWWARSTEECDGCEHRRGGWCGLMGLPCTINPILTIRHGMIGMACMGGGYKPLQLTLPLVTANVEAEACR